MNKNYYAVIMAGGVGSRFWPLSRKKHPKQFLDVLNSGQSLFQTTFKRFASLCPSDQIYTVANIEYDGIIKEQVPDITDKQVLLEPVARNTAPCIAYAAYKIYSQNPDAVLVVAPSDHLILNEQVFLNTVEKAMEFAAANDVLVTLGIKPNRPDTGYGYIQMNEEIISGDFYKVKTFTEKPDIELAKQFVKSGEFLWNAGIFIMSVRSIVGAFENYLPEMHKEFDKGTEHYYTNKENDFIASTYEACQTISIDYGIMEKADNVYVMPADFGWSDIGTWNSLFEFVDKDENNNASNGKNVFLRNAKNCIVNVSDDKLLAVNNVENLIIVEADGIILVADKNQEQDIRHVVNEIKSKYRERFI